MKHKTFILLLFVHIFGCMGKIQAQSLDISFVSEMETNFKGGWDWANKLQIWSELVVYKGLSVELSAMGTYRLKGDDYIGEDFQMVSNLVTAKMPFSLPVAGVKWQINDAHTLHIGIRTMDEDYFQGSVASFYTNASWGINPTLSTNYPICTFPLSSLGIHYRYEKDNWAAQGSIYNGIGYYKFRGRENMFRFCPKSDGVFALAQGEYHKEGHDYYLGASVHYGNHFSLQNVSTEKAVSTCLWTYTEQQVSERTAIIVSYSHDFGKESICTDYAGAGFKSTLGRTELGSALTYARMFGENEFDLEVGCKIPFLKILYVQPTVHATNTNGSFSFMGLMRLGLDWSL